VGSLHWLIIIPFYFFTALSFLLLIIVVARVLRLKVGVNPLVMTAVTTSIGLVAVPLIFNWADLHDYEGRFMLAIGLGSFVLAGLDVILQQWLPLPLDDELAAL
jgi:hypothetical protein